MINVKFNICNTLTSSSVFEEKEVRHPAQVEHHEDDLPLGQDQDQQAGQRGGEGHAGRHQSRIFRCGIICPYHVVFADYCFQYKPNVKYKSFCAKLPLLSLGVVPLRGISLGPVSCSPDPRMTVDLTAWTRPGRSSRMVRAPWRRSGTGGSRSSPPPPSSTRTSPSPADSPATRWWCSHLSPADIPTRPTLTEARKRRAKARINKI